MYSRTRIRNWKLSKPTHPCREGQSPKGTAAQLAEKVDVALDFWVAQRFTAAITCLFSDPALAAEVRRWRCFRSLFSRAASRPIDSRALAPEGRGTLRYQKPRPARCEQAHAGGPGSSPQNSETPP